MPRTGRRGWITCSMGVLAVVAAASCGSSPSQPSSTPASAWRDLTQFGEIVGTSWTGTAQFTTAGGQTATSNVTLVFLWNGACDIPGWCAQGYSPFGWGTLDGTRVRIRGYQTSTGYNRALSVGEDLTSIGGTILGSGRWDIARLSGDRQRLEIVSSDFAWDDRRGVTFELTRAPWPTDFPCPSLVSCGSS